MLPRDFFARTQLEVPAPLLSEANLQVKRILDSAKSKTMPANASSLYQYKVPKLSVDGVCSLRGEFDAAPYDLTEALGGRSAHNTSRLLMLDTLISSVHQALKIDWLGVYQVRNASAPALVKLAYRGIASRAEFPLTRAFAAKSNNSAVAMTGKARLINDVAAHLSKGGAYYECDPNVQAEACLPVFDGDSVVGIIDAEHSARHAFTPERVAMLVAICFELPAMLPAGGTNAPTL